MAKDEVQELIEQAWKERIEDIEASLDTSAYMLVEALNHFYNYIEKLGELDEGVVVGLETLNDTLDAVLVLMAKPAPDGSRLAETGRRAEARMKPHAREMIKRALTLRKAQGWHQQT